MGDILTVHDAAKRFGFSTKYIYAKIQAGELKSLRKQGTTFIDSDDLLPSPHEKEREEEASSEEDPSEINETLEALKRQISELKEDALAHKTLTPKDDPKVIAYLEDLVKEQKEQISQLRQRPQDDGSDQKMLEYLQEVIDQQRTQIVLLQERLEQSQKEVLQAIKEANSRKDEQLKQYIEFLNNSTKELITSIEHNEAAATSHRDDTTPTHGDHDVVDVDVEIAKEPVKMRVSDYLKAKGLRKKERRHYQKHFLELSFKDQKRFTIVDDELYLYPYLYDYDALLKRHSHKKRHKGKD